MSCLLIPNAFQPQNPLPPAHGQARLTEWAAKKVLAPNLYLRLSLGANHASLGHKTGFPMPCINHPQRVEVWYCPQCTASFCNDCVDLKMFGYVKVEICPKCRDKVLSVAQYQPAVPFWSRLPEIIRYPLQDDGWMRIVAIGAVAVVLLGLARIGMIMGGLLGLLGALSLHLIYSGIVISYFYLVISRSESGDLKPPDWPPIAGLQDLIWPTTQFMLTILVVFMPALIFLFLLLGLNGFEFGETASDLKLPGIIFVLVILGLIGLAILPMGLLLLGVFRNALNAWNPIIIFGQILKIPKEYLAALGFLILLEVGSALVWIILRFVDLALGAGFFAGVIKYFINSTVDFYFLVVAGHLLGYLAYQCRFQLGWWHDTREPSRPATPTPVALARPTGHPDLVEGFRSLKQGAWDRAEASFQAVLQEEPDNLEALRGLLDLARQRGNESLPAARVNKYLELSLRRGEVEAAYQTVQEISAAFPSPAFDPRWVLALAKGLREKKKYYEAALLLRQFAVWYPEDTRAATALYQCGEILSTYVHQSENARKILEYLLQRYPSSELTGLAQALLKQIPPPGA